MTDDDQAPREPIAPPARDRKAEVRRAGFEALAQATPVTAALAQIYRATHPPRAEAARETWEIGISARSNEHDARLDAHAEAPAP